MRRYSGRLHRFLTLVTRNMFGQRSQLRTRASRAWIPQAKRASNVDRAFEWPDVSKHPAVRPHRPPAGTAFQRPNGGKHRGGDNSSRDESARINSPTENALKLIQLSGEYSSHTRVDRYGPAIPCRPSTIFNAFSSMSNSPRPRWPYAERSECGFLLERAPLMFT